MTCVSSFNFTGLLSCTQFCRGDIAQGTGRDITGQNDDRDLAMQLLPQLCGDLEPVQAAGQIVVGEDEVGPDRPSRHHSSAATPSGAVAV